MTRIVVTDRRGHRKEWRVKDPDLAEWIANDFRTCSYFETVELRKDENNGLQT